jgi:hypothetical protein
MRQRGQHNYILLGTVVFLDVSNGVDTKKKVIAFFILIQYHCNPSSL